MVQLPNNSGFQHSLCA